MLFALRLMFTQALAWGPDPTLGLCLLFDLVALAAGPNQSKEWHAAFLWTGVVVTLVVIGDSFNAQVTKGGLTVESTEQADIHSMVDPMSRLQENIS